MTIPRAAARRRLPQGHKRAAGRRRFHTWSLIALVLCQASMAGEEASASVEFRVKAAMIYNITRFVQWPAAAFRDDQNLVLCVLGATSLTPALETVAGKTAQGRRLVLEQHATTVNLRGCHVLFVPRSAVSRAMAVIEQLAGKPVLTVSDLEGFAASGGIIGFVLQDNKIRFEVNLRAAKTAELAISSKLLKLASKVWGDSQ